ncbi:MAG: hypothetical protein ACFFA3_07975 [Promethearchaeota archaeon]
MYLILLPTFFFFRNRFCGNQNISYSQDDKKRIVTSTQEALSLNNDYQLVDPINITTWSDWALYPFITGNGTDLNPFIIENIQIIGDGIKTIHSGNDTILDYTYAGIFIGTNGSFNIQNCKISNTSIGIRFLIGPPSVSYQYKIMNVEITECSIGIYNHWHQVRLNVSNCYIANCNWVSITTDLYMLDYLKYGGIGVVLISNDGAVEDCRIENCSIGMTAEFVTDIHNNELINCGIVLGETIPEYDSSNTVNGKPIGLFWGDDNLVFTQTDASKYGQLIFISCPNLKLSNIHIKETCSIGIQVFSLNFNQTTKLKNIICENQNLGMYIKGLDVIGHNLYVENCEAGFYFADLRDSTFTKIMIDNSDIPIYGLGIQDSTFEIEQSTKLYFVEPFALYTEEFNVKSSDTEYNISMTYIPELGNPGYVFQFNDTKSYHASLYPAHLGGRLYFTVISVPRYTRPGVTSVILGYPLFWLLSIMIIGILIRIGLYRKGNRLKLN